MAITRFILLSALLLSACRSGLDVDTDPLPLRGTVWMLNHMEVGGTLMDPDGDEVYSLLFDSSGVLRADADCNDCLGTYYLEADGSLELNLQCTEAACGPSGSSISRFGVFSTGLFNYAIEGSRLTLQKRQSEGSLFIVFDGS